MPEATNTPDSTKPALAHPSVQHIPAGDGWYFTHPGVRPDDRPVFHRVALWRADGDEVIGLIGVQGINPARLVTPPPVEGGYIHVDNMTRQQLEFLAEQRKPQ